MAQGRFKNGRILEIFVRETLSKFIISLTH